MQKKQFAIVPEKMQQDISVSRYPADSAFEVHNMRFITINGDNTTLSITNEKSNKKVNLVDKNGNDFELQGIIIGHEVFDDVVHDENYNYNDYVILFTTTEGETNYKDCIYRLYLKNNKNDEFTVETLFRGDIGLDAEHPIESTKVIENEYIHKIYWVDGKNQPRMANVSPKKEFDNEFFKSDDLYQFDFKKPLDRGVEFNVEKLNGSGGSFPAGVVQYALTFYNKNGGQSNVIANSPLLYISDNGMGLAPDKKESLAFRIKITNPPTKYDYIQVYRILRTSINSTPDIVKLYPYKIDPNINEISFIDDGIHGESVSSTELLFLNTILFEKVSTMAMKDNTLFFGNYSSNQVIDDKIIEHFNHTVNNDNTVTVNNVTGEYKLDTIFTNNEKLQSISIPYLYKGDLDKDATQIAYFKGGETYRFGIQFLDKYGTWSNVLYIGDYKNDQFIETCLIEEGLKKKPKFEITLNNLNANEGAVKEALKNYIAVRPVCVYPNFENRTILCQGIAVPTVYNLKDRVDGKVYAQSSWFARPNYLRHSEFDIKSFNTESSYSNHIPNSYTSGLISDAETGRFKDKTHNLGSWLEYRMVKDSHIIGLPDSYEFNSELQYSKRSGSASTWLADLKKSTADREKIAEEYKFNFGIDKNIITIHSPELDGNYTKDFYNTDFENIKLRLVGMAPVKRTLSYETLEQNGDAEGTIKGFGFCFTDPEEKPWYSNNTIYTSGRSLITFPFWVDNTHMENYGGGQRIATSFPVYPWHRDGALNNRGSGKDSEIKAKYKKKTLSNLRICLPTRYLDLNKSEGTSIGVLSAKYFQKDTELLDFKSWDGRDLMYKGNYEEILSIKAEEKYPIYINSFKTYASSNDNQYPGIPSDIVNTSISRYEPGNAQNIQVIYNQRFVDYHIPTLKYNDNTVEDLWELITRLNNNNTVDVTSVNPINIAYKSTEHMVVLLDKIDDKYSIIPNIYKKQENYDNNCWAYECNCPPIYIGDKGRQDLYIDNGGLNIIINRYSSSNINNKLLFATSDYIKNYYNDSSNAILNNISFEYSTIEYEPINYEDINFSIIEEFPESQYKTIENKKCINHNCYEAKMEDNVIIEDQIPVTIVSSIPITFEPHITRLGIRIKKLIINSSENSFLIDFTKEQDNYVAGTGVSIPDPDDTSRNPDYITFRHAVYCHPTIHLKTSYKSTTYNISNPSTPILTYSSMLTNNEDFNNDYEESLNLLWQRPDERFMGISQKSINIDTCIRNKENSEETYNYILSEGNYTLDDNLFYFPVVELYRDNIENRFGGTTEVAFQNNKWVPCGELVTIPENLGNSIALTATVGDTYYQRYDHLKTEPYNDNKQNNIIEIVSFSCESHHNLNGRYDRWKGKKDNTLIDSTIFNKYNPVYSQVDNYFTQNYYDKDLNIVQDLKYNVLWSNPKVMGAEIDPWMNLNASNCFTVDSKYGTINKLENIGNEIFIFQDTGIARLLYNNRVQVQSNDGIPIELSNSGKVEGKVYVSNTHGCKNKWSIVNTPTGVYFVDNVTKSIMHFNGNELIDLSYTKNVYNWAYNTIDKKVWNPQDWEGIVTLYDLYNSELYFTTNKEALTFSEKMGQFTSLYDYGKVQGLININGDSYQIYQYDFEVKDEENNIIESIKKNAIYLLHGEEDDYMHFFNSTEPHNYSLTLIANPEFNTNKVFESIEFRTNDKHERLSQFRTRNSGSSSYPEFNKYPFDRMFIENDYQHSTSVTKDLIKKFRTWRWGIKRDSNYKDNRNNSRDRISDNYIRIKLTGNNTQKLQLYDFNVNYYN